MGPPELCESCQDKSEMEIIKKAARIDALKSCGAFEDFFEKNFSNFIPSDGTSEAIRATKCINGDGRGVLLFGPPGVGKTHLICAAINSLLPIDFFYQSAPDLLCAIKAEENGFSAPIRLERAKNATILILDDLGAEKWSDKSRESLYRIINHRYGNKKTTLISSNEGPADLECAVGYRVFSRLVEMCKFIQMSGEDFRKKKRCKI